MTQDTINRDEEKLFQTEAKVLRYVVEHCFEATLQKVEPKIHIKVV